ncbi:MAG: serine--tRNA ligase [Candidatus Omnitrophica bacterium]|nr:serine--tRNA ligase [Candidatus Omnitrophota bacterium]
MLDLSFIRQNPEQVKEGLARKRVELDLNALLALDEQHRQMLVEVEQLRHERKKLSEEVGQRKRQGHDADDLMTQSRGVGEQIAKKEEALGELGSRIKNELLKIPNIPHSEIPTGGASANEVAREWGEIPSFDFEPQDHVQLGEALDILDMPRAAKISGSGFVCYKGMGARLERALISFMLDLHCREHGYTEIFPPLLVNTDSMTGTGQLPKMKEDMYKVEEEDLYLIPTAEVPVTNLHRDEILEEAQLPVYYHAFTPCFRREAGSYGAHVRGMTRVHQFNKVELVKFVKPGESYAELESLVGNAEKVLELLGLPYRRVVLASGDLSFAAAKCYDLEAWAAGCKQWLEVSSCSNFEDFQARRAGIRFKPAGGGKPRFVHTLNGSGVATARTLIALIENYQQADGTIRIPEVLQPYLDGLTEIQPAG